MMHARPEPVQRLEMLGHAIALVGFETVAGTILRQLHISRSRVTLAMIDAAAIDITRPSPPITASQSHGHRSGRGRRRTHASAFRAAPRPRAPAPTARRAGYCRDRSAPARRRPPRTDAVAQISSNSSSRRSAVSRLESSIPFGIRFGSSTTAAATTGPASGPRPASSQPATGQTPRLISARSRRKLGGATAMTPLGGLAVPPASAIFWRICPRIMPGWCASARPAQPGTRRNSRYSERRRRHCAASIR